jgi:hypothetical protein
LERHITGRAEIPAAIARVMLFVLLPGVVGRLDMKKAHKIVLPLKV